MVSSWFRQWNAVFCFYVLRTEIGTALPDFLLALQSGARFAFPMMPESMQKSLM
jgi:hypothetical protein